MRQHKAQSGEPSFMTMLVVAVSFSVSPLCGLLQRRLLAVCAVPASNRSGWMAPSPRCLISCAIGDLSTFSATP
jgi:hypothetical protein